MRAIPGPEGLASASMGPVREFILVTHTRWDEAPRIRHQLARLLAGIGHRVLFVERADGPMTQVRNGATEVEPGPTGSSTTSSASLPPLTGQTNSWFART